MFSCLCQLCPIPRDGSTNWHCQYPSMYQHTHSNWKIHPISCIFLPIEFWAFARNLNVKERILPLIIICEDIGGCLQKCLDSWEATAETPLPPLCLVLMPDWSSKSRLPLQNPLNPGYPPRFRRSQTVVGNSWDFGRHGFWATPTLWQLLWPPAWNVSPTPQGAGGLWPQCPPWDVSYANRTWTNLSPSWQGRIFPVQQITKHRCWFKEKMKIFAR